MVRKGGWLTKRLVPAGNAAGVVYGIITVAR